MVAASAQGQLCPFHRRGHHGEHAPRAVRRVLRRSLFHRLDSRRKDRSAASVCPGPSAFRPARTRHPPASGRRWRSAGHRSRARRWTGLSRQRHSLAPAATASRLTGSRHAPVLPGTKVAGIEADDVLAGLLGANQVSLGRRGVAATHRDLAEQVAASERFLMERRSPGRFASSLLGDVVDFGGSSSAAASSRPSASACRACESVDVGVDRGGGQVRQLAVRRVRPAPCALPRRSRSPVPFRAVEWLRWLSASA